MAVWKLCGPNLEHLRKWFKFCSVFSVGFAALLVLSLVGHILFLRTETVAAYLFFAAVAAVFSFMAYTTVRIEKDYSTSIQNIQNGDFKVLDVFSEEFDMNIDTTEDVGVVRFRTRDRVKCRDWILISRKICMKYRGVNQVPLLYVWEPGGDFYRAYGMEEIMQFGSPEDKFYVE